MFKSGLTVSITSVVCLISFQVLSKPVTPANVEAFFDVAFEAQKFDHELVGATIAVVKDGEVLLKKGYGFADLEERIPVDPDKHLFRIASISKTFTWTAVMQLVEKGKLDLEADIQTYLDFDIPKTFDEPIRLKHLLTHTPGFEEQGAGGFTKTSEEVMPLAEYLPADMPARVRKPGTYMSYSNYGSAVAGYIVESVSGVPWADFIQQNILDPLAMTETNIYQPMSESHRLNHAKGYRYQSGKFNPSDYWFELAAPAGVMSSTAGNMVNWMLLHLNHGELNGVSILQPETSRLMQSELFRQHPDGQPILHGFYRSDRNGIEVFGHGGDLNQFHSNFSIIPEHNLALFVSYNSDPGGAARSNVIAAFLDYFYPQDFPSVPQPNLDVGLQDYVGGWTTTRRNHSTFAKLALLVNSLEINADEDELMLAGQGGVSRWVPEAKDRFRGKYSNRYLLFYRNENNDVSHFSFEGGVGSFERVAWYETNSFNVALFAVASLVSLLYLARFVYVLIFDRNLSTVSSSDRWWAAATGVMILFLIVRLAVGLSGDTSEFIYGVPDRFHIVFGGALLLVALTAGIVVLSTRQWIADRAPLLARISYSVVATAALVTVYQMWFWNVLSFYFS